MRSKIHFAGCVLFAAVLAGCGGSGSSSSTGPAQGTAELTLSATTLAFGSTTVGQASAPQSITLTNSGTATLTLSSATVSDPADYAMTSTCGQTLAESASCTLSFAFKPQSAASLPATMELVDNAGNSPQAITLTGMGTAAPVPQAVLSLASLTFIGTAAGSSSAVQTLTLTNSGNASLGGISISLGGNSPGAFAETSSCSAVLAAGANCSIGVTFNPASASTAYSAVLTVTDNSGGVAGSTQTSALNGSSAAPPAVPQAVLSASSLTFAATNVNTSAGAQTVTLSNPGTGTLTGIGVSIGGGTAPSAFSETTSCGSTLTAGSNCSISVNFTPQSAGSLTATLSVTDDASGSPQTISLAGAGAAPQAVLSSSSVSFPNTAVNTQSAAPGVTLTNSGNATLNIASIVLGGTNVSDFGESTTCTATLAAGSSCTIAATFTPAAASSYSATITVTDNASGSPLTIALTGTGTAPQAVLSTSSVSFPNTAVNTQSAAPSVTLTNSGNATLNISSISLGGTNASNFAESTTCGGTLAVNANCTISATFTPAAAFSYSASITVVDNASGSPQIVSLTGTGTAPQAVLSSAGISFPTTTVNTQSAAYIVTLTNNGNAALNIASIVLGGPNASDFGESATCGGTLAANASCAISATFTPAAASSYSATITVTDNASGSPQTIGLSGFGTTSTIAHTLYVVPEADSSVTPLYALIDSAQNTIDMTMYALEDSTFIGDLAAACNRGVTVRVILDQNDEKSGNTTAFNQLNAVSRCSAVWANPAFEATHEKSFIIDGTQVAIMSLNLQSQYYSTTRDFALLENDPSDIAAIQAAFNQDYAAGTTSTGTSGASDFSYQPGAGDDLIWSPTTAQADMLSIIDNAQTTLLVENEEMGAGNIVSALESACQRHVTVQIAMVNQSSYAKEFAALVAAGCGVNLYPDTSNGFYIHAKAVVADYGLSTQSVYMGSINYSNASMNNNRELGVYITDPASVQTLYNTMAADYAGGTPY